MSVHWDKGLQGWGAGARPGLHEGEVSGSRDTTAFHVLLKQLLQSLHVEHVVVVYTITCGDTEAPGWSSPL